VNDEVTRPPVVTPRIVENHAGQPCYLVEYDEDQWNRYGAEDKEFCFDTWAKKAKPLGALFVVLKLFPDPIFPSSDRTTPYVVRSYPVEHETFNPVKVSVRLSAEIHADTWERASEGDKFKLKIAARQELAMHALACPGCSYTIWTRSNDTPMNIEQGKL
jgi:hypothetical protein